MSYINFIFIFIFLFSCNSNVDFNKKWEEVMELRKNRQRFIDYHSYKQDGLASQRVADLAIKMYNDSRL